MKGSFSFRVNNRQPQIFLSFWIGNDKLFRQMISGLYRFLLSHSRNIFYLQFTIPPF